MKPRYRSCDHASCTVEMGFTEASFYSAGVAILLFSIYVLNIIGVEGFLGRIAIHAPCGFGGRGDKLESRHVPKSTAKERDSSQHSSRWWTDAKQFRLEKRAFFSKVCTPSLGH